MVNCQIDKVKTEKALESYISEIFCTLQNHYDVSKKLQTRFFYQRQLIRSNVQSFKPFGEYLHTFKNSGSSNKVALC